MTLAVEATAGTWHDQAQAVADAASGQLRLISTDPDRASMLERARSAMRQIDLRLELRPLTGRMFYEVIPGFAVTCYASESAPPDVMDAALQLTVELHRRKDAPFGVLGAWSPTGEPLRISRELLAGVDPLLAPHIEGWGMA